MLLSKKMKKKKYIFVSVTQKTMMNAHYFTTINMEIYILMHYQLLSPALRMYKYIQLKIQLTKL